MDNAARESEMRFGGGGSSAYEVTVTHQDGRAYSIGFTTRTSLQGLLAVLSAGIPKGDVLGIDEDGTITRGKHSTITASGWTFAISQFTEKHPSGYPHISVLVA